VRAVAASLRRPHLVAPLWRQRQTTLCCHGASIQGGERERGGRGERSTLSREAPLGRGVSSSGSHEAARAMEVSTDVWG
jgi:hypothetical protein